MILDVRAREVFDSRKTPTVECEIRTNKGRFKSIVPSGASVGKFEALELRDNDIRRFNGKGVLTAVSNINNIIKKSIKGMDETRQKEIDNLMIKLDGTKNKSKLGANAILAVSMSVCRAGAASQNLPLYEYIRKISKTRISSLPVPSFNVINGGKHAKNALGFQEFMIFPKGAKNFKEAMAMGAEVYKELKNIIKKKYGLNSINIGDEGGFAPLIESQKEALELLNKAIKNCNYTGRISINIDCAASEFYSKKNKNYNLNFKSKSPFIKSSNELIEFYKELLNEYNITSIEDPFMQEDWSSFSKLTKLIGAKVQIVGDDLLATNLLRIKKAIEKKACNALLLKINQIGSITESINAANLAKSAGFSIMVSHRSGETSDDFIADLSVGIDAKQIKSGAPFKSERMRKYKRLIKIEQESNLRFAGKNFR